MKKFLFTILVTLTSTITLAGQVDTKTRKQVGINEPVTIQSLGSNWGYTKDTTGFNVGGKSAFNMVPVTREAAQVLQSLDKSAQYNCIVLNSTFVKDKGHGEDLGGGTYYIIDINCN